MSNDARYRPEIDGLRAVAVLPVILFHAGVEALPGGFVGVDIFFVISGFLITQIILREVQAGQFSFVAFYERRARRILPALFLVVAVTSLVSVAVMLPFELKTFGEGVIGVVLFVSNIVFWRQSGYFAAESELNPLLHTWSLAVEEQFYICAPLVLAAVWQWRRQSLWLVLASLLIVSLVLSDVLSTRMASANFYLIPTRAWELTAGALLAVWLLNRPQPKGALAEALGIVGLALIATSIASFGPETPFPSLYTVVPVVGTVCVLWGTSSVTLVGRCLGLQPILGIGLISYSAYLWHQPLFAFARLLATDHTPDTGTLLGLAVVALLLAWASWVLVEQPFRRKDIFGRQQVFRLSLASGAVLIAFGGVVIGSGGLLARYPQEQRSLVAIGPSDYADYVVGQYGEIEDRRLATDRPNLVLVGDSYSQDFFNGIREAGAFQDHAISAVHVLARCQIWFGVPFEEVRTAIQAEDRSLCKTLSLSDEDVSRMRMADVVVFASNWQPWAVERFAASLSATQIPRATDIFVVGPKRLASDRRVILDLVTRLGPTARVAADKGTVEVTDTLRVTLPEHVTFIDISSLLCPDECPVLTPEGALISYDGAHLTREGAAHLADAVFSQTPLSKYRGPLGQKPAN